MATKISHFDRELAELQRVEEKEDLEEVAGRVGDVDAWGWGGDSIF